VTTEEMNNEEKNSVEFYIKKLFSFHVASWPLHPHVGHHRFSQSVGVAHQHHKPGYNCTRFAFVNKRGMPERLTLPSFLADISSVATQVRQMPEFGKSIFQIFCLHLSLRNTVYNTPLNKPSSECASHKQTEFKILTVWSRNFLEELIVVQLVNKSSFSTTFKDSLI
jgi:hypothetical protein